MAGFKVVLFIAFAATTLITVTSRAVNISNTWVLPEEGFPVFYRYFRDRISWTEADAVCQFHHANLVTVDTTSQYDAVRAYLKELDIANNVWIGLSRTSDKRNFTWRDFRELSLTDYWQEAIPTGNDPLCAVMDPAADFRWHAFQCAGPSIAAFICELPVPTWATGPQGCLLTELPSLTVLYIPEQSAVELTSDCGLGGTKRIACKGNTDRDDMVRRLACDNTDVLDDKTLSPVPTVANQDVSVKTTKSWIWTSNTIDTGDYGLPTRHRRETEDTSPSSTNFKTESLVTESITVVTTITESEVETTASLSTSPENEEFPSAINQGQLFSIIENGSVFDVIELNGTEENKTATVESNTHSNANTNAFTTVIYHKEPTEDSTSMLTKIDDITSNKKGVQKGKPNKFSEGVKKIKTITKFVDNVKEQFKKAESKLATNTKASFAGNNEDVKQNNVESTKNIQTTTIDGETSIKPDTSNLKPIDDSTKKEAANLGSIADSTKDDTSKLQSFYKNENINIKSSEVLNTEEVNAKSTKPNKEEPTKGDDNDFGSTNDELKGALNTGEFVTTTDKHINSAVSNENTYSTTGAKNINSEEAAHTKSTIDDFITRETNSHNPFYELDKTTTSETDFLNKEIDMYPLNTNPSLKLNRTNRKELPIKPDDSINIDVDNNIQDEQHKMVEITLHHPGKENTTKSTLFVTTRRVKKVEDSESTTMVETSGGAVTKSPTEESLAAEPTVKPNRQRQLTRPQRRSFYPYFFSRVLG